MANNIDIIQLTKYDGTPFYPLVDINSVAGLSTRLNTIGNNITSLQNGLSSAQGSITTLQGYFDANGKVNYANLPNLYIGNARVMSSAQTAQAIGGLGTLLPGANNTYDLGSSTLKWRGAYFGGTVNVGDELYVAADSYLHYVEINGGLDVVGNLSTPYVTSASNPGNNWISLDDDDSIGFHLGETIAYFNSAGLMPAESGSYDLGSTSLRWGDLYVNGAYFGQDDAAYITWDSSEEALYIEGVYIKSGGYIDGNWRGSIIGVGYGGTGKSSWTQNGVVYASASNALAQVANVTGNSQKKFLVQTTNASGTAQAPAWGGIDQRDVLGTSDIGSTSLPVYYKGASNYALAPITDLDLLSQATNHGHVKAKRFYLSNDVYFEWIAPTSTTDGYVKLNAPLLTTGDQIVGSGTPGGGGGGGSIPFLTDLQDVIQGIQPSANKMLIWSASGTNNAGTTGGWTLIDKSSVGVTTNASQSAAGLMSSADKAKLDAIEAQANKYVLPIASASVLGGIKIGSGLSINASTGVLDATYTYTLPLAANGTRGGIQIGYSSSGKNYAVQLSSEKAYVNVPWTDTTYKLTLNGTVKGTTGGTDLGSFYAPTSSGTSGHVLISGGANTAPSFRALVANDIPSLAISKITNLQSSLNAKLTKSGDTMTGQLTLGSTIPVRTTDVDVAPMYGNALYMRGTTGYIEGLKVNSAEGDYFYCADRRSEYTVTSNYKSGSPTVGEYGGSDCAYLFDLVSANRFMLYCPNLETTPWVLTIVKNSGQITATDVLDLWFFQTSNVGYLNSYKIEVLTQITGTSTYEWFTVVDRNNVNDRMHQAAFPIWLVDDTHGTANHSYGNCAGIRITIRKADPTGTWSENYLPICAVQLRDRRPSHKPSAGIGAMDMRGGTFYGDVWFDYGTLRPKDVYPASNGTYTLGNSSYRWSSIYGGTANLSGALSTGGSITSGSDIYIPNNKGIYFKDKGGTYRATVWVNSATVSNLYLGYGITAGGGNTYVDGNKVYLRYGSNHTVGVTLNNDGAVTIAGATTLSSTLAVAGKSTLTGGAEIPASSTLKIGDATIKWIPNSGNGYLKIDKPLLTTGDQIVGSGTPSGGGGGGASYLSDLLDLSNTITDKPDGSGYGLVYSTSATDKNGSSGAWIYIAPGTAANISGANTTARLWSGNVIKSAIEAYGYVTSSGVTSVATGIGLTGGTITNTGTLKVKLKNETLNTADSAKSTSTNGGLYSIEADKSGNLAVRVPWVNTWNAASTSQAGYVPKLALASTATIATQSTEYVLTYISGTETAPVWRKLPANAFNNNTYTNGTGISLSGNTFSLNVAGAKTALGLGSLAYKSSLVAGDIPDISATYVTVATAQTISAKHTFSSGILLNTASSWTSSDRAIAFSADGEDANIRYYYTDSNKGLTFNPNTGELKAAKFTRRGGTSSQFLKADGSVDSNTYLTGNQTITLSGDVSGSGTTSISVSIGSGKVTNAMLAGSIAWSKLSVSASNITSTLGTTAVSRATADADGNTISSTYVKKAGDTMTGDLIIEKTGGGLTIRGERLNSNANGGYIYLAGRYYDNDRNGVKIAAEYPGSVGYDVQDLVIYTSYNRSGNASPVWQEAMRIAASGQTFINGQYTYSLYIDNIASGATSAGIRFRTEGTVVGGIFVNTSNDLYFSAGSSSSGVKILTTSNYDGYALPLSAGSSYPLTGHLFLNEGLGIQAAGGIGLLVYHPTSGWSGIDSTQWGLGSVNSQGVIRSSNSNLLHYKGSTSYSIWDASNSNLSTVDWAANNLTAAGIGTFDRVVLSNTGVVSHIEFTRAGWNYISTPTDGVIAFNTGGSGSANTSMAVTSDGIRAGTKGVHSCGLPTAYWGSIYGKDLYIGGDAYNTAAGSIIFSEKLDDLRNGFKIAPVHAASANRVNLVFYRSNNDNSPWAANWTTFMTLSYDGKVTIAGSLTTSGDQVISSDATLKTNWRELNYTVKDIANAKIGIFDWKDGHGTSAGSVAQDWKKLIPELVHGDEGNMTLAYGQVALLNTVLLARHEDEQDKEIKELKERINELEDKVKQLTTN